MEMGGWLEKKRVSEETNQHTGEILTGEEDGTVEDPKTVLPPLLRWLLKPLLSSEEGSPQTAQLPQALNSNTVIHYINVYFIKALRGFGFPEQSGGHCWNLQSWHSKIWSLLKWAERVVRRDGKYHSLPGEQLWVSWRRAESDWSWKGRLSREPLASMRSHTGDSERHSVFTGYDRFCLLSDLLAQFSSSRGWNSLILCPSQILELRNAFLRFLLFKAWNTHGGWLLNSVTFSVCYLPMWFSYWWPGGNCTWIQASVFLDLRRLQVAMSNW